VNIPATKSMEPRPVWARLLFRQKQAIAEGLDVDQVDLCLIPPTDAEKHDAIRVLYEGPFFDDEGDAFLDEAQRIMDECSI